MITPSVRMASWRLLLLGEYHWLMLLQFEDTNHLGPGFEPVLVLVRLTEQQVRDCERGMLPPRIKVKVAGLAVDTTLRQLHAQARLEDGGKTGAITLELFPDGLTPVVQPVGQRQVDVVEELLRRSSVRQYETHPTLGPRLTKVIEAKDQLADGLQQRQAAHNALALARAADQAARADFVAAYTKDHGLLRALYPKDKDRVELFFDRFTTRATAEEEGEDDGGEAAPE